MQIDTRPEDVSAPHLARITQWMRRWVDSGRLPGLLVAIVRNDRLVWFETCGHRDVETKRAVEPDTLYRIYSMTKPITTVAALALRSPDGTLSLAIRGFGPITQIGRCSIVPRQ